AYELRTENQSYGIGQIKAVSYLFSRIAEIERYCDGPCLEDAKVNGQPLQAVHQKYRDFLTLFYPALDQQICHAVGFFVKYSPRHVTAVFSRRVVLNKLVLAPYYIVSFLEIQIDFCKAYLIAV